MHLYPDRRRGPRVGERRDRVELPRRDLVDGDRRHRSRSRQGRRLKRWAKAYWEAVHPYNLGGAYVNFMMDDEGDGARQATYGDNYERLAAVKEKYDPKNLFRVNQNIQPARATASRAAAPTTHDRPGA